LEVEEMMAQGRKNANRFFVVLVALAVALAFATPLDRSYAAGKSPTYAKSIKVSVGKLDAKFSEGETSYDVDLAADQATTKLTFKKAGNKSVKSKKGKSSKSNKTSKTKVTVKTKVGSGKWSKASNKSTVSVKVSPKQGSSVKVQFEVEVKQTVKTVNKTGNTTTKISTKTRTYIVTVYRDEVDETDEIDEEDETADEVDEVDEDETLAN
jgi:hypothetical protein